MDAAAPATRTYEAKFPKAAQADYFAADLARWSPRITDIAHRPRTRTVTFVAPADVEFRMDVAEFVGYHGSPPQGPVATLDGMRTPRCY